MTKLIILDRDGVINQDSDHYVRSVQEWIPIPGSIEAIARLTNAGYQIAVATNQSGIARGYFSLQVLEAMHEKMLTLVKAQGGHIDGIYFCPHGPEDDCHCRKPDTGLIEQALQKFNGTPEHVWVVGDSLRDLQAGAKCGCKIALVLTGKGLKTQAKLSESPEELPVTMDVPVFNNLQHFVEALVSEGI
ncbi:D-glycero-beta-D-manno-heptose 1,7-bisphosphate 7-phosphatase [Endozoicomonas ascidiicola]|uniref:D-glycero-beta-D-manno-heptose 1,7-bisphosphate 7-phosphatase n=1 Tax=Endozoicomonas ascidiicola TaxID=1698521 RepID=UPI0008338808|nr:D-glycero-beta-D-manno-heptose 1,7-bisphosphate 7-phosphatase [Endozoicomonas ascidiicola]